MYIENVLSAVGVSFAEVAWGNSILNEEDQIPLWGTVVLGVGRPEEESLASLGTVQLGQEELPQELFVLIVIG